MEFSKDKTLYLNKIMDKFNSTSKNNVGQYELDAVEKLCNQIKKKKNAD